MKNKKHVKKNGISACLVIHNEEKLIKRCIDSFKDIVDEIIIVHSGKCTDRTLQICKKYTKKIYIAPDYGVADPNRALSFSKAKKEWILRIDGDEYLSKELREKILELVKDKNVDGYACKWNFYNYRNKKLYDYKLCLVRRNNMLPYEGYIHEPIRIKGNIVNSDFELMHRPLKEPYSFEVFKNKGKKWARIQGEFLVKKRGGNFLLYFLKMIFFPPFYFIYSFVKHRTIRISFLAFIYNLFVYWYALNKSLFHKQN